MRQIRIFGVTTDSPRFKGIFMTEGVNEQEIANPETKTEVSVSDKEYNFRRLEAAKEEAKERAMKAEMENSLLKQRLEMLEQRLEPKEQDPLEGVEDYVDPARHKASLYQLEKRLEKRLKKEAEEAAERKLQEQAKQNHMVRLRSEYPDYDQIMNEKNVMHFEQTNPEFLQSMTYVQDDYERKKLAYNFFKKNLKAPEPKPSIKEKVEENAKNPYYIPPGSGSPAAVDFDIKSPEARRAAYEKLKMAQRKPIGSGGLSPR